MNTQSAIEVLRNAQQNRAVIEDFCPLAESIEWKLGRNYLRESGNVAFLRDAEPVPYGINNDGVLSVHAAELLFRSLVAKEKAGKLDGSIFVLELGIGVGLFARFFLDNFRQLCFEHNRDYYDRLCYVAADYSQKMLDDAGRHGIFSNHVGRYIFRVVDALCPIKSLANDLVVGELNGQKPFHAVFLNYLLDCLPAAVLKIGPETKQLYVRTCLDRGVDPLELGDLKVQEIVRLAENPIHKNSVELRRIFGLLVSEYEFHTLNSETIPNLDLARRYAHFAKEPLTIHNFGAIASLDQLLELTTDSGFILINDYGQAKPKHSSDFEHQRYSQSTFIGINFPLLEFYYGERPGTQWIQPTEDESTRIYARLLGRELPPETIDCFQELFGSSKLERVHQLTSIARNFVASNRFESAIMAYQEILEIQPFNWLMIKEVGQFLSFSLKDPSAGLEMARNALEINPACSPDLWNLAGDSLFELGRIEESRKAYMKALEINPNDLTAHFNLTYVHSRTKEYALALQSVASAFVLDKSGVFRERLLQTQAEILGQLARGYQQQRHRNTNRVSMSLGSSDAGRTETVRSKE